VDADNACGGMSHGGFKNIGGADMDRVYGAYGSCFLRDDQISAVQGQDNEMLLLQCPGPESKQVEDVPAACYGPPVSRPQFDTFEKLGQGEDRACPDRADMRYFQEAVPVKPEKIAKGISAEEFPCGCPAYNGFEEPDLNVPCVHR